MKVLITGDVTVNQVIAYDADLIGVLNAFAVDTCCGGNLTLAQAAQEDGVDLQALLAALNAQVREET